MLHVLYIYSWNKYIGHEKICSSRAVVSKLGVQEMRRINWFKIEEGREKGKIRNDLSILLGIQALEGIDHL